ncbi:MAG: hypothetical protein AB7L65_08500, partial [Hyphomonadaceae bacterium]
MAGLIIKPQAAQGADSLAARLNIRARARADGADGRPLPDARDLSPAEQDIGRAIGEARAEIERTRAALRIDAERAMRTRQAQREDLRGPLLDARLAMRQAEGRIAHDLAGAAQRARQAAADLASFQRVHGLRRLAVYPDSRVLQAGLLLCAALFEALFSAALFAQDDARGLLGGAVTAIGLSGANVVLGFLAGYLGLRYLQHARFSVRVAGAAAFACLGAMALFLNFFAAIWRQRIAQGASADDAGNFFAHMFALTEPQAIVLLMLGGGVWVFSALKGYSGFDDPYPDYGKMDRAAAAAEHDLSALRAQARAMLEAPIEDARAALAQRLEKLSANLAALSATYDETAERMGALDAAARKLD